MIIKGGKLMSDWIKCTDRMPGKYTRVLVTNGKGVCIGMQQSRVDSLIYCSQYCDCDCHANGNEDYAITHWMPLPSIDSIEITANDSQDEMCAKQNYVETLYQEVDFKSHYLHLKCLECNAVDLVLLCDAKEWACPHCEYDKSK